MRRRTPARHACHRDDRGRHDRDRGVSLIEILIAIVLLGTAVTAVLTALRTTTQASGVDEDHAIAFAWLQDASEEIYRGDRWSCYDHTAAEIRAQYQTYADNTAPPASWPSAATATIAVTNVQFLGKSNPDDEYEWGDAYCLEGGEYATAPQYTQRVTIEVVTPKGLVKTLQMVKGKS